MVIFSIEPPFARPWMQLRAGLQSSEGEHACTYDIQAEREPRDNMCVRPADLIDSYTTCREDGPRRRLSPRNLHESAVGLRSSWRTRASATPRYRTDDYATARSRQTRQSRARDSESAASYSTLHALGIYYSYWPVATHSSLQVT
jgi:hypothetical protein